MHVILASGHRRKKKGWSKKPSLASNYSDFSQHCSVKWVSVCWFFFPPHPLLVAMATGVEDLVLKKKSFLRVANMHRQVLGSLCTLVVVFFFCKVSVFFFFPFQPSSIFPAVFWWFSNNQISVKSSIEVARAWAVPTIVPGNFIPLKQQDTGAHFNPLAWLNLHSAEKLVGNTL